MKSATLILLPGLLCDAALWKPQMETLKDCAECMVPDLTQQDSMAAMAQAVLARAPQRFALAGLSLGGYVAFEIMREAPERVMRLCLLDTWARPDTPELTQRRQTLLKMAREGNFKGVTALLLPHFIHASRIEDAELTGIILGMAERVGPEAFVRQETAMINRPDSRPLLPLIRCPVQVIGGRQDVLTPPEMMSEMADAIPGARLDILQDCGHLTTLEKPEQVSELMRKWLTAD